MGSKLENWEEEGQTELGIELSWVFV